MLRTRVIDREPFGFEYKQLVIKNQMEQDVIAFIRDLRKENPQISNSMISLELHKKRFTTKEGRTIYQGSVKRIIEENDL